ncbi:MAG TPA: helix-hairpin-helix domain-containing protein [Cyclobacteriaceae bacterium]
MLIIFVSAEPFTRWMVSNREDDFAKESASLDSLSRLWVTSEPVHTQAAVDIVDNEKNLTFAFDPNTATEKELESLGFSTQLRNSLIHYRERGGKLRVKSDLMKIYGMDASLYARLSPFIQLPDTYETKPNVIPESSKKELKVKFDLNKADTVQLKTIFGIGSKLSARIVKYRNRLGGFINVDQLREVYGLDTLVIRELLKQSYMDEHFQPEKININQLTGNELNTHPYLDKKLAKALAAYRFQHGDFKQVEEIRSLQFVTKEAADKIIPYLKVN